MTLSESMGEEAALGWFQVVSFAVLSGPKLAPGEPAAERESFSNLELES
jgi:type I restriction enzyme R subunit